MAHIEEESLALLDHPSVTPEARADILKIIAFHSLASFDDNATIEIVMFLHRPALRTWTLMLVGTVYEWTAWLTPDEVEEPMVQYNAVRLNILYDFSPLVAAALYLEGPWIPLTPTQSENDPTKDTDST